MNLDECRFYGNVSSMESCFNGDGTTTDNINAQMLQRFFSRNNTKSSSSSSEIRDTENPDGRLFFVLRELDLSDLQKLITESVGLYDTGSFLYSFCIEKLNNNRLFDKVKYLSQYDRMVLFGHLLYVRIYIHYTLRERLAKTVVDYILQLDNRELLFILLNEAELRDRVEEALVLIDDPQERNEKRLSDLIKLWPENNQQQTNTHSIVKIKINGANVPNELNEDECGVTKAQQSNGAADVTKECEFAADGRSSVPDLADEEIHTNGIVIGGKSGGVCDDRERDKNLVLNDDKVVGYIGASDASEMDESIKIIGGKGCDLSGADGQGRDENTIASTKVDALDRGSGDGRELDKNDISSIKMGAFDGGNGDGRERDELSVDIVVQTVGALDGVCDDCDDERKRDKHIKASTKMGAIGGDGQERDKNIEAITKMGALRAGSGDGSEMGKKFILGDSCGDDGNGHTDGRQLDENKKIIIGVNRERAKNDINILGGKMVVECGAAGDGRERDKNINILGGKMMVECGAAGDGRERDKNNIVLGAGGDGRERDKLSGFLGGKTDVFAGGDGRKLNKLCGFLGGKMGVDWGAAGDGMELDKNIEFIGGRERDKLRGFPGGIDGATTVQQSNVDVTHQYQFSIGASDGRERDKNILFFGVNASATDGRERNKPGGGKDRIMSIIKQYYIGKLNLELENIYYNVAAVNVNTCAQKRFWMCTRASYFNLFCFTNDICYIMVMFIIQMNWIFKLKQEDIDILNLKLDNYQDNSAADNYNKTTQKAMIWMCAIADYLINFYFLFNMYYIFSIRNGEDMVYMDDCTLLKTSTVEPVDYNYGYSKAAGEPVVKIKFTGEPVNNIAAESVIYYVDINKYDYGCIDGTGYGYDYAKATGDPVVKITFTGEPVNNEAAVDAVVYYGDLNMNKYDCGGTTGGGFVYGYGYGYERTVRGGYGYGEADGAGGYGYGYGYGYGEACGYGYVHV